MLTLKNAQTELIVTPECGGGVAAFRWRGRDIFRAGDAGGSPLDLGCFPMAPFSGRIAGGRFSAPGLTVSLSPNHPCEIHFPHVLHGFDWLSRWAVKQKSVKSARIETRHDAGAWPWTYRTEQVFTLTISGYAHCLSITNQSATPMPTGLGLHPYFPRAGAKLTLAVYGVWDTTADRIPVRWLRLDQTPDWLDGAPIDTCFTGRRGDILIGWPSHRLTITPDKAFSFAVVFTPKDANYFCVEPASHMPDAVNRNEPSTETGLRWLKPGERWTTTTIFSVAEVAGEA